ncbi:MAG: acetyl-CoA hydrolase/transferase C-terminal domain-containing protein [Syntrophomonadaceae bacterium]|nr:acetyl-CoA hydrolase/transferase C-terminal domain-containing protein [Syntrophomonadaceae bacterium]
MSSYADQYRSKLVSPEEAVKIVKSGDWIDYGFGHTNPYALDKALAARKDELKDIKIRHCLSLQVHEVWKVDPKGETFTFNSWHFSGADRKHHDMGLAYYIPMIFRNEPVFYRKSLFKEVDVAMLRVTAMNKHGYFNFHCANAATRAQCDVAKKIILEVNPKLPWAMGGREECIHISEVDYIVEADSPVQVIPPATPTETDKKIAQLIVEEMVDGSCIQLGIGGLPNMVGTMIAESDLKDLGCHTEMLVDAYYHMYEAGKLTNRCKGIEAGKSVYAFAAGSQFLYDWMDNNPGLATFPVNYTNNPHNIAMNDNMMTINNCVEVDLFGQISSESSGPRHISGTGGQLDFTTGAYMSKGGKAFICCTSSYKDKQGNLHSRIVPMLPQGSIVTVPRTQAHIIVTEFGKADLAGRSTWERAERIISIAHPDKRDELVKAAEQMGVWRKSNKL